MFQLLESSVQEKAFVSEGQVLLAVNWDHPLKRSKYLPEKNCFQSNPGAHRPSLPTPNFLHFFFPTPWELSTACSLNTTHLSLRVSPPAQGPRKTFSSFLSPCCLWVKQANPFGVLSFLWLSSTGSDRNNKCQGNNWALSISQSKF